MKLLKKYKYNILAFFVPVIIVVMMFLTYNCFIGQRDSFLISDLRGQYISLFSYLKDIILNEQSILYSFSKGLGGNMIGTFSYYLGSPLNLLVCFFSKINLEEFISILLLLKFGLCGLTMYMFLSSKSSENKKLIPFMLSVCYALNSYIINYYFNIMWLDAIYILPLILLGIDKIIDGKKGTLYIVSLAYAIFCNYYMGYMICLFSAMYYIYKICIKYSLKKEWKACLKKFGIFISLSLLSVLTISVLLIPTILDLQNTDRSFGTLTFNHFNDWQSLFVITSRLFVGSNDVSNLFSFSNINIYCGLLIIPLVYLYFFNKGINKKEKIASLIIILIFICSVCVPHLNYIWHGFNFPQGFVNRFSFIFIAFLIVLANKCFCNFDDKFNSKHYFILIILYFINALLTIIFDNKINTLLGIYISCGMFLIYIFFLYLINNKKYRIYKQKIILLLLIICCAELFANAALVYYNAFQFTKLEYRDFVNKITEVSNKYNSESDFYRIESDFSFSSLDSFLGNYKSANAFLSTNNTSILNIAHTMGLSTGSVSYNLTGRNTPLLNNLLGVKYLITDGKISDNYESVDNFEYSSLIGLYYGFFKTQYNVYENKDALSLGYMVSEDILYIGDKIIEEGFYSQLYYQNLILKLMTGSSENIFDLTEYSVNNNDYIVKNASGEYYVEYRKSAYTDAITKLVINDNYYINDRYYVNNISVVFPDENNKIKVTFQSDKDINHLGYNNIFFYKLNQDNLDKSMDQLKQQQLKIEEYDNGYVKGNIDVKESNILFTTIPYEKGWTILVDDKKVDYYAVLNGFIGFDLDEGHHTIEMKFFPPGLKIGAIFSMIGVLITVIYAFNDKIKNKFNKLKKV